MALENSQGNYLRICDGGVDPIGKSVSTETWKDATTRTNPSPFDKPIISTYDVAAFLDVEGSADATKSIRDNLTTAGYNALKRLDELSGFNVDA